MILPSDTNTARAIVESWVGTVDAIKECSTDPRQRTMTLHDYYTRYISIVDKS